MTAGSCSAVVVVIMERSGVNCRRPPRSLTRVIDDRRLVKVAGSIHLDPSSSSMQELFAQIGASNGESNDLCAVQQLIRMNWFGG